MSRRRRRKQRIDTFNIAPRPAFSFNGVIKFDSLLRVVIFSVIDSATYAWAQSLRLLSTFAIFARTDISIYSNLYHWWYLLKYFKSILLSFLKQVFSMGHFLWAALISEEVSTGFPLGILFHSWLDTI